MSLARYRPPVEAYFQGRQETHDMGKRSARGGLISVFSQGVRFAAQLISLSILARLLTPEDFGYLAMAMILINLFKILGSNSFTTGLVQQRTITEEEVNGFFWISAGMTILLTVLTLALAPAVSWFFKEKVLVGIVAALAAQVFFAGITGPHYALLTRTMSFGLLSMIELVSGVLSKILGVVAAFMGAGFWALVVMSISQDGIRVVLVWYFCVWRPTWVRVTKSSSALVRFGVKMTLSNIFNTMSGQIDGLLIGRFWDSVALGLYSKSLNLVQLPSKLICWPLEIVAVSTLSRMQDEGTQYNDLFLSIVQNFVFFTAPLITMMYLTAPDVVLVVLGDQWKAAIPIFEYLSLYMLVITVAAPIDWFLVSTARLRKYMILMVAGNVVRVVAIAVGMHYGPVGVAMAMAIAMVGFTPATIWYALRHTTVTLFHYGRAISRVAVAIVVSMSVTKFIEHYYFHAIQSHLLSLVAFSLIDLGLYMVVIMLLPGGKQSVMAAIDTVKFMLKKTSGARP